jgi:hypothetical protein
LDPQPNDPRNFLLARRLIASARVVSDSRFDRLEYQPDHS